jgi:predicted acylesterase/phospholipase RssA/FMN phosphatase YigB (HAD superfamily)
MPLPFSLDQPENRWIIFDADNTLWNVEGIYNRARTEMAEYVAGLCAKSPAAIESFQQQRDRSLNEVYGYSASRFARSFEDTIHEFVPNAPPDQVRHVRALAEGVFAQKADLTEDVELVLRSLYSQGWLLGLLTAGEAWVQHKRIAEFHLQGIFHAIEVVERKTAAEFRHFCQKHNVAPEKCWVVGDSMRSDIAPASNAGLNAILVPHENWSVVEGDAIVDAAKYKRVDRLRDILDIVGAAPIDLKPSVHDGIDCYGIFEGGGAKGLAHVGALKACEQRHIRFKGVAGTSAGAIVAGLFAVGYGADELFMPDGNDGTRVFDQDYIALLGRTDWHRGQDALGKVGKAAGKLGAFYSASASDDWRTPFSEWAQSAWRTCQIAYAWMQLGASLRPLAPAATDLGYFSLEGFQSWYNEKLASKLGMPAGHTVTFADIDFDLRIISADLRASTMVVHSKRTFPARSVAEAVAASICLPLIFKPQRFPGGEDAELHVDGGMLSNFPAWVFSDASRSFPDNSPVLGFELVNQSHALATRPSLSSFLQALLSTAISGKKDLEIRGIPNMHFVPIQVSASTLQFDTNHDMRKKTYLEGFHSVSTFFPDCPQLVTQAQMSPFLYAAHQKILSQFERRVHLRLNVMDVNSLGRLAIRYNYNMDFDPDDMMDLPLTAGGAGRCFTSRKPILVDLHRARREYPIFKMSKYEQALVRPTLRSLLSVPIFDARTKGEPLNREVAGVLNIDSDDLSAEELGSVEELALESSSMISYVWHELAKHGYVRRPDEGPESVAPEC